MLKINGGRIKRELQASLYNGKGNTRNGILGVVLPEMQEKIYKGKCTCPECGEKHNWVVIDDDTTIRAFSRNFYIKEGHTGCCWSEDERYCVLVSYNDFMNDPNKFIDRAYDKRTALISKKVIVRPKE